MSNPNSLYTRAILPIATERIQSQLNAMADRKNLRATALFTLLLITEAMYTEPMKAAKRDMKTMVKNVLKDLSNSSTCKSTALYSIRCLAQLKNDTSECDLVSIYNTYLTEATALDIQPLVTEQLQSINQYLQDFHSDLCKPESDTKICEAAFKESDGDYENFCKVMWLLEHFRQWLSR